MRAHVVALLVLLFDHVAQAGLRHIATVLPSPASWPYLRRSPRAYPCSPLRTAARPASLPGNPRRNICLRVAAGRTEALPPPLRTWNSSGSSACAQPNSLHSRRHRRRGRQPGNAWPVFNNRHAAARRHSLPAPVGFLSPPPPPTKAPGLLPAIAPPPSYPARAPANALRAWHKRRWLGCFGEAPPDCPLGCRGLSALAGGAGGKAPCRPPRRGI